MARCRRIRRHPILHLWIPQCVRVGLITYYLDFHWCRGYSGGSCSLTTSHRIYQEYYSTHQLLGYSHSSISWIGSVQVFWQFAGGAISGPLFDRYGTVVRRYFARLWCPSADLLIPSPSYPAPSDMSSPSSSRASARSTISSSLPNPFLVESVLVSFSVLPSPSCLTTLRRSAAWRWVSSSPDRR